MKLHRERDVAEIKRLEEEHARLEKNCGVLSEELTLLRRKLPDTLPHIDVIHDIPEDEKQCGCGAELKRIGEEVCSKLDVIPMKFQVINHI